MPNPAIVGSPSAGTFMLSTTYGNTGVTRQDLWTLEQAPSPLLGGELNWTSVSHTLDPDMTLGGIVATPEGEVWGAGSAIVRLR